MKLFCDNQSVQAFTKVDGGNRLRHMVDRRDRNVKECVKRKFIKEVWFKSSEQLADVFTKALTFTIHAKLSLWLMNIN